MSQRIGFPLIFALSAFSFGAVFALIILSLQTTPSFVVTSGPSIDNHDPNPKPSEDQLYLAIDGMHGGNLLAEEVKVGFMETVGAYFMSSSVLEDLLETKSCAAFDRSVGDPDGQYSLPVHPVGANTCKVISKPPFLFVTLVGLENTYDGLPIISDSILLVYDGQPYVFPDVHNSLSDWAERSAYLQAAQKYPDAVYGTPSFDDLDKEYQRLTNAYLVEPGRDVLWAESDLLSIIDGNIEPLEKYFTRLAIEDEPEEELQVISFENAAVLPGAFADTASRTGWKTYTDPRSFSFSIPDEGLVGLPPWFSATFVGEGDTQVDQMGCDVTSIDWKGYLEATHKTANGITYCVTSSVEGAAGHMYVTNYYSAPVSGGYLVFQYSTDNINCYNYSAADRPRCATENAARGQSGEEKFEGILNTVVITK